MFLVKPPETPLLFFSLPPSGLGDALSPFSLLRRRLLFGVLLLRDLVLEVWRCLFEDEAFGNGLFAGAGGSSPGASASTSASAQSPPQTRVP